jgi:hypothetical protein
METCRATDRNSTLGLLRLAIERAFRKVLSVRFLADGMLTSSDDVQRILLDDPSTSKADVESLPATNRFHLIAFLVARVKAVRGRLVSAQTNPSLFIAFFVRDQFVLWHWY